MVTLRRLSLFRFSSLFSFSFIIFIFMLMIFIDDADAIFFDAAAMISFRC